MKLRVWPLPDTIGWRDHVIGAALFVGYVSWLLAGAPRLGFPRDEGAYFRAGESYFRWWRLLWDHHQQALENNSITAAFSDDHEHPPLMKTLFGASHYFLHEKWHVFDQASTSFRFPAMCMAGLALWVTYLFGARAFSRRAGIIAASLLALMPRVFFHAHLSCFDVPVATMWIVCLYVHWRATETRKIGWFVLTGVTYGLMLATKHNAWFFPPIVAVHALFVWGQAIAKERSALWRKVPWGLLSMATLGPAVFLMLWPYLWFATEARLKWWIEFQLNHEYYNIEFLGKNYFGPPSPPLDLPVMIAATVPTVTLLLFGIGAVDRVREALQRIVAWVRGRLGASSEGAPSADPRETDLLLFLGFCVAVGPFILPKTPIFGATKHWLTAYPVLAIVAGRGFDLVARAMERAIAGLHDEVRRVAHVGLAASVILGPMAITSHSHPFGLSTYVPFVGGTQGGADLGLNRQFWGFTTQSAAEQYLNEKAPRNATVFILDTTWEAWAHMQEEHRVRPDLRVVGAPSEAMYALVQHELHMNEVDYDIWVADRTDAPVYVVTHDDVPIVSIYQRQ